MFHFLPFCLVPFVPFLWLKTIDGAFAQDVVLDAAGHHFRQLKLAQNFRWPDTVRLSLADGRVVHAHEFLGGRNHDFAVDERKEPGSAFGGKSQLEGNRWILLG